MVTALPGGAADKAGNRYEHLWTVTRIAEILEGGATRIRLEPPGEAGSGIEFEIDGGDVTWGDQAKDSAGTWTINKLTREGVLPAAKTQIELGRRFRFVASAAASDLATLADRARKAESIAEYTEMLGKTMSTELTNVATTWAVTAEEAWLLLRNVEVEHISAEALARIVSTTYKRLYAGDPDLIVAELRSYCDDHVHEILTAPQISAHLESKGFKRRLLVGDTDVLGRLHKTLERQQRRVERAAPTIGLVPRNDVERILAQLKEPDAGQVVVIDGPAGSGKSAVVSAVASTLEAEGWFVAVARMDIDATTTTSEHLGQAIGLSESPSVLLAGVADGSPALLVIDQLDAVSTYSGRMADNFDAVDEVMAEIGRAPNIKVLLVARTVDLNADPRLRSLLRAEARVERHTVGRLALDDVKAHLAAHDIPVPTSEATLELLRTPLHLAVFSRLSALAREVSYITLQDLYARYTEELRVNVADRVGGLDWAVITSALVTYMSDNEVLTAPAAVLDAAAVPQVHALESEAVLTRDETGVAFFHESYFDYLFARSFVAAGDDLHAFLARSGQHLFRRAQARQVLEHLAATDRERFRDVVVELLRSDDIRSHLKDVVTRVLRQIQAQPEDWLALDEIAWGGSRIGSKLLLLLNQPAWFDAADTLEMWQGWLEDPDRVGAAFHQLTFAARERPERAAQLVRPHIAESEEWRLRLRYMISWSLKAELVDLAVDLVQRGQLDDARGPIAINSDFWSIVYSVEDEEPDGAARLIGAFLDRGLVRARVDSSDDPFESDHLSTNSQTASVISDVAGKVPSVFVESVLPFVLELAMANQHDRGGLLPAGRRWGHRYRSSSYGVDHIVFDSTDDALRKLAVDDPARCAEALVAMRTAESDELRFLVCRALGAGDAANDAVEWLVSDKRNLSLGWSDSPHWAARELIEKHSSGCSDELFGRLQALLLEDWPSWESRAARGRSQYELLSALDGARMSDKARRHLGELERRFPNQAPQPPSSGMAHFVGPPISDDASTRMSDDNWLSALHKHADATTNWNGPIPVGGAPELAHVLGRRAKEEPERFAKLALRFTDEIPAVAINDIIRNVEGSIDADLLADVCEHASQLYGADVGRAICSAAGRAGIANERIVSLIEHHAHDADPDHESARTRATSGEYFFGGDLFMAGLNSTRGEAALSAASILFSTPDHLERLLAVVEDLATDTVIAVRVCAAEAVVALLNHDRDQALQLAERLFDAPVDVFDAHTSERLLTYGVLRDPERFQPVLERALAGPGDVAKRAGRVWAVARMRGALRPDAAADVRSLPAAARRGAAEMFAGNAAESVELLQVLFNDNDPDVREQAARAMRDLAEVAPGEIDGLIEVFTASEAFADHMEHLVDALEGLSSKLPASTIRACERAVDIAGSELGDITTARSAISRDLITVVLRLYRQGDAETRTRCLDVVDRLTELNAYDVERALEDER